MKPNKISRLKILEFIECYYKYIFAASEKDSDLHADDLDYIWKTSSSYELDCYYKIIDSINYIYDLGKEIEGKK